MQNKLYNILQSIRSFNEEQLDKLSKVICVDATGRPCGMDFKSIDPDYYDCKGTDLIEPR